MRLLLVILCCVLSACVKGRLSAPIDIGHIQSPELPEARYSGGMALNIRGHRVVLLNNLSEVTPQPGRDRDESPGLTPRPLDLNLTVADRTQLLVTIGSQGNGSLLAGFSHQISGDPLERSTIRNRSITVSASVGYNQDSDEEGPYQDEPCACSWRADYKHYSLAGSVVAGLRASDGLLVYGGPFLNVNFFEITVVRKENNSAWTEHTDYHRRLTALGFSYAVEYSFGARRRIFTSVTVSPALLHWNDTSFSRPGGSAALTLGWRF